MNNRIMEAGSTDIEEELRCLIRAHRDRRLDAIRRSLGDDEYRRIVGDEFLRDEDFRS